LLAKKLDITPAQLALAWGVQRGVAVIPKSESPERLKANITLTKLAPEDVAAVDSIHKLGGMHRSLLSYHQSDSRVFGWTYEQLGWPMLMGGIVAEGEP
jgi:glycerol 2-dehydrogenase (NADP+)